MERPEIKDKKVLDYVDDLERQLYNFKSEKTIAKSYIGFKNIVDQMNEIMCSVKLIVEDVDEEGMNDDQKKAAYKEQRKQQQYLEKSLEISDRLKKYVADLKDLEKQVNPDVLQKEIQKGAGAFEKVIKDREGK